MTNDKRPECNKVVSIICRLRQPFFFPIAIPIGRRLDFLSLPSSVSFIPLNLAQRTKKEDTTPPRSRLRASPYNLHPRASLSEHFHQSKTAKAVNDLMFPHTPLAQIKICDGSQRIIIHSGWGFVGTMSISNVRSPTVPPRTSPCVSRHPMRLHARGNLETELRQRIETRRRAIRTRRREA